MSADDLSPNDLAEQVIRMLPRGNLAEWGAEMVKLARFHKFDGWLDDRLAASCANYVKSVKTSMDQRAQSERLMARGVAYNGRAVSPTISIAGKDGGRQTVLWVEASPQAFMEAVLAEQSVIDGRNQSNRVRFQLVALMQEDPALADLPTLGDVCRACGIDPDTLGLGDLGEAA